MTMQERMFDARDPDEAEYAADAGAAGASAEADGVEDGDDADEEGPPEEVDVDPETVTRLRVSRGGVASVVASFWCARLRGDVLWRPGARVVASQFLARTHVAG